MVFEIGEFGILDLGVTRTFPNKITRQILQIHSIDAPRYQALFNNIVITLLITGLSAAFRRNLNGPDHNLKRHALIGTQRKGVLRKDKAHVSILMALER